MKKNKYISAKTQGNITESIVESWLQELGIKYKQENTMSNTRTRSKGSVDFTGPNIAIEVKKFTKSLSVKILSEDHDVKWSQVCILSREHTKDKKSGLLITEDNISFIYIPIGSFLKWLSDTKRKSITFDIGAKIGYIVRNSEDLKRVLEA